MQITKSFANILWQKCVSPIVSLQIVFVLLANKCANILWQKVLLANSFANSFVPNCLLFPLSLKADQGKTLFSARNFSLVTWISNSKSPNLDFNNLAAECFKSFLPELKLSQSWVSTGPDGGISL